jgi:hypothetical protein
MNEGKGGTQESGNLKERGVLSEEVPPTDHMASARDVAGAFLFYVGVPAIALYPVGAALLWLQINNTYHHGFVATWHAVALIPQTLVAALGASVVVAPFTLVFLLIPLLLTFLLTFFYYAEMRIGGVYWRIERHAFVRGLSVMLVVIYIGFQALVFFNVTAEMLSGQQAAGASNPETGVVGFLTRQVPFLVATGGGALAGYLLAKDRHRSKRMQARPESRHHSHGFHRWAFRGLLVAYAANIVFALGYFGIMRPFLPEVEYGSVENRGEGQLLGITPGYWHLLNQKGDVVSIPNDDAATVVVLEPSSD